MVKRKNKSVELLFKKYHADFKKNHLIEYKVDEFFGGNLFGYSPHYVLTHPFQLIKDGFRSVKWAWQRVYRGWDDTVVWGVDVWLNDLMSDILSELLISKHGTPLEFFDGFNHNKNGEYSSKDEERAKQLWDAQLLIMIRGFQAMKRLDNCDYLNENETKKLEIQGRLGLKTFIKYYRNLWD